MKLTDAEKRELRAWANERKAWGIEIPHRECADEVLALLDELESLRSINKGLSDKCELLFREDEAREEVTQSAEEAAREYAVSVSAGHLVPVVENAFLAGAKWERGE